MKKGLTEIVFILDRSGSMSGLEADTIGGYNSLLNKQKSEKGEANVTTVLFDHHYELLHDRIKLRGITPVTEKEYFVRGTTALLDAIGISISKIANVQKSTSEEERAERVLFVIITDGLENSSRAYTFTKIKEMVERQKNKYGWEFIFLGANIDAIETANRFGINEDRAVNYHPDKAGTVLNYAVISETISRVRSSEAIDASWKDKIDADYNNRRRER